MGYRLFDGQRDIHRDSMTGARLEWLARYDIVRNRAASATAPSKQRRHCHDDGGFALTVKHARSAVGVYRLPMNFAVEVDAVVEVR